LNINTNKLDMGIKKQTIDGTKILYEVESSNIDKTEYDTATKEFIIEFKNGTKYKYEDVPHASIARFKLSESQGKYFNSEIAKKYKYTKI